MQLAASTVSVQSCSLWHMSKSVVDSELERLDETIMKLSFRGAIYESPFPTLELTHDPADDYNNGVSWRFQQLKAIRSDYHPGSKKERNESSGSEDAILLAVWEPASTTETRTRPFLFVAKHLLRSEEEARATLKSYLEFYAQNPAKTPPRVFVGTKEITYRSSITAAKQMSH